MAKTSESVVNMPENSPKPKNNITAKPAPVTKPICLKFKERKMEILGQIDLPHIKKGIILLQ